MIGKELSKCTSYKLLPIIRDNLQWKAMIRDDCMLVASLRHVVEWEGVRVSRSIVDHVNQYLKSILTGILQWAREVDDPSVEWSDKVNGCQTGVLGCRSVHELASLTLPYRILNN